jgi:hypothetical protein
MAEEGIKVPGEGDESSQNPTEAHAILVEAAARKQGWKPLNDPDYKGDPADWVDAKEFVGRRPLFDTIHDLKRQLVKNEQQTSRDMQVIKQQFSSMQEVAFKRALEELQAARDNAIANADVEVVKQLDKEIETKKFDHIKSTQVAQQVTQQVEQTPYMKDWREKNPWFDKDPELQDEAVSIGVGYMMKNQGVSQEKMLAHVSDRIKKIYPEKFPSGRKITEEDDDVGDTTSKVEGSTSTRLGEKSKKGKLTVADLTDEQKQALKTFLKTKALSYLATKNKRTETEEYLASIQSLG